MRPCHTYTKRSFISAVRIHEVPLLQQQKQLLLISSCACERIKNTFFLRFHNLEWLHHLSEKDTVEMFVRFLTNASQLTSIRLSYKRSALKGDACAAKLLRGISD